MSSEAGSADPAAEETTKLVSAHDSVNFDSESLKDTAADPPEVPPVDKKNKCSPCRRRAVIIVTVVLGLVCAVFIACALVELWKISEDNTFNKRTFIFFSDTHTDVLADCARYNQSTFCRSSTIRSAPFDFSVLGEQYKLRVSPGGFYGRYGCDAPKTLVESMMESIHHVAKSLKHEPEFIINGGDIPAHDIDHDAFIVSYEHMFGLLQKYFPNKIVVQAVGNNDANPPYDPTCDSESLKTVGDIWLKYGWLERDQEAVFKHSGAHARNVTKDGKLRVVALNSNQFLSKSWPNSTPNNDCGQLDWFDSELTLAAQRGQTVLVLIHSAPVIDAFNDRELWGNQSQAKRFRDIIQSHNEQKPGLVQAILMGHVHKDEYRILHATGGDPMVPVIVAPAISPVYDNNPGYRIMYFDEEKVSYGDTKRKVISIRDYDQYYMDLRASYIHNSSKWEREYRFSSAYGKKTLRTNDYVSLHQDLSTHSKLMTEFMTHYAVHYSLQERATLCAFNSNNAEDYQACYNNWS